MRFHGFEFILHIPVAYQTPDTARELQIALSFCASGFGRMFPGSHSTRAGVGRPFIAIARVVNSVARESATPNPSASFMPGDAGSGVHVFSPLSGGAVWQGRVSPVPVNAHKCEGPAADMSLFDGSLLETLSFACKQDGGDCCRDPNGPFAVICQADPCAHHPAFYSPVRAQWRLALLAPPSKI